MIHLQLDGVALLVGRDDDDDTAGVILSLDIKFLTFASRSAVGKLFD